jgi:hypothetical protein
MSLTVKNLRSQNGHVEQYYIGNTQILQIIATHTNEAAIAGGQEK